MNSRALSLFGSVSCSRAAFGLVVSTSLAVAEIAAAQPAPPPSAPTAMAPQPVPPSPPPAPPDAGPPMPAPIPPSAPQMVPGYPMQPYQPWPTAMQPYPLPPPTSDVLPAPPNSPVAPLGAPLHMPPGYADQPGLYPPIRSYERGMLVSPGYHVGTEPLNALWISGAGTFAGAYATSLIVGLFAADENDAGYFFIPIAGPVVFGATAQVTDKGSLITGMTFLSLVQATGVAMFIGGLAARHQVLIRNDRASVTPSFDVGPGRASFRLTF